MGSRLLCMSEIQGGILTATVAKTAAHSEPRLSCRALLASAAGQVIQTAKSTSFEHDSLNT